MIDLAIMPHAPPTKGIEMHPKVSSLRKKSSSTSLHQASLLRHLNTRVVLEALQKYGALSRADISRITGISGPTITRTVKDLLDDRLVEEGEPIRNQLGRPGKVIRMASSKVIVVGVVLEKGLAQICSAGLNGESSSEIESFSIPQNYDELIRQLSSAIKGRKSKAGQRILGVGVILNALVHSKDQSVLSCPELPFLENRKFAKDLSSATGLEMVLCKPAMGLCLAERLLREMPDLLNFAVVDIRNGFDVGVIADGKPLEGHAGLALNFHPDGFSGEASYATEMATNPNILLEHLANRLEQVLRIFNPEKLYLTSDLLPDRPEVINHLADLLKQKELPEVYHSCEIMLAMAKPNQASIAAIITALTTGRKHTIR